MALSLAEKTKYKKGIANAYEMSGASYSEQGKYDSAVYYYRKSIDYARHNNLDSLTTSVYNHIANVCFYKSDYPEALVYYDSARQVAERYNNSNFYAVASSNIASVYYKMGNYSRALEYYLAGITLEEINKDNSSIATNYSNIANVYYRLKDYQKALEYLEKGLTINRKNGFTDYIIGNLTTYALIYNDKQMYDSSLYYLNQALELANQLKDPYVTNIVQGNIAEAYFKKGSLDTALALYKESQNKSQQIGDAEGLGIAKAGIGEILLKQNSIVIGRKYLIDALKILQNLGVLEQALSIADKLARSYEETKDYEKALYYFKIKGHYTDSMEKVKSRQDVEQLLFNHEMQKKEDKIKLLEKDNAIIEAKNNLQQTLLWTVSVGFLLALIIAFLFYWNVHNTKKSNEVILKQNKEIEEQAEKLAELNRFKDNTFSVLAHDLRSPVNALTSTMMLLDEKIISPEEFIVYKTELNNKLQSVSMLLDNMLYWAKSQMKGENQLNIQHVNIRSKVVRVIATLTDAASQKNITLINKVPEEINAYADRDQLDIVLRNIIANAIKFTHTDGEITTSSYTDKAYTYISIADNGVGMTAEQVTNLFKTDKYISTTGTVGEKGTGLGLQLCYEIIVRNGGEIQVKSAPGLGSVFTISLPASPKA